MFEDTKGVIRRTDIQWLKGKRQKVNNDLQTTTQKTKDRTPRTPLRTGG